MKAEVSVTAMGMQLPGLLRISGEGSGAAGAAVAGDFLLALLAAMTGQNGVIGQGQDSLPAEQSLSALPLECVAENSVAGAESSHGQPGTVPGLQGLPPDLALLYAGLTEQPLSGQPLAVLQRVASDFMTGTTGPVLGLNADSVPGGVASPAFSGLYPGPAPAEVAQGAVVVPGKTINTAFPAQTAGIKGLPAKTGAVTPDLGLVMVSGSEQPIPGVKSQSGPPTVILQAGQQSREASVTGVPGQELGFEELIRPNLIEAAAKPVVVVEQLSNVRPDPGVDPAKADALVRGSGGQVQTEVQGPAQEQGSEAGTGATTQADSPAGMIKRLVQQDASGRNPGDPAGQPDREVPQEAGEVNTLTVGESRSDGVKTVSTPVSDISARRFTSVMLPQMLDSIRQMNSDQSRVSVIRLKLEPENMGEIKVKLSFAKGELTAHFFAGSGLVKDAVECSLPQLKEALAQYNISLGEAAAFVGQEQQGRRWSGPGFGGSGRPEGGLGGGLLGGREGSVDGAAFSGGGSAVDYLI